MTINDFREECKRALHDLNTHDYLPEGYSEDVKNVLRRLGAHDCKEGLCQGFRTCQAEAENVLDDMYL